MELTKRERYFKVFEKYMDGMKGRSVKWFVPGFSGYHDHKIRKFMRFYAIPINYEDIIMFLDTTVFRSAKEGFLFTTDGILIKEVMEKLVRLGAEFGDEVKVVDSFDVGMAERYANDIKYIDRVDSTLIVDMSDVF